MSGAYLFISYKKVVHPDRLAGYGELAVRAIEQFGGAVVARAQPSHIYEAGQSELTVLVRFSSVSEAAALYDSTPYQEALAVLGPDLSRDVRIIPAL